MPCSNEDESCATLGLGPGTCSGWSVGGGQGERQVQSAWGPEGAVGGTWGGWAVGGSKQGDFDAVPGATAQGRTV